MNDRFPPPDQPDTAPNNASEGSSPYQQYESQGYLPAQPGEYAVSGQQYPQADPQGNPQGGAYYYQNPASYPYPPVPQPTDGLAIAALVTGVLGMAIVPLILGVVSLNRIKKNGAPGRGMAIAGVVLGAIGTLAYVLLFILLGIGAVTMINSGVFDSSSSTGGSSISTTSWTTIEEELVDNPDLRSLYESCADGDMKACDDLYLASNWDSPLEKFADNCGGKGRDGMMCNN